jgi:hypothetical protein
VFRFDWYKMFSLIPKMSSRTPGWKTTALEHYMWGHISNINPPLQLSIQRSAQRTSKWPNSEPHWATRQQAIAKTPAKWSAYQIPSVIVVFVILVFKVWFVRFIPKNHKRPWT